MTTVDPATVPPATANAGRPSPNRRLQPVNLARRPFANTRHIRRLGIALWVVGGLLLALDGALYWRSLFGIESKKEERAAIDAAIATERDKLATAERQLAAMDLGDQNVEVSYLNDRIAQRTFPWSELFDQLAEVLPRRVRLFSLAPMAADKQGRGSVAPAAGTATQQQRVYLQLTGVAESDEALLELLDNLFGSPAFDAPQLPNETRGPQGIQFAVNVFYLPRLGRLGAPAVAATPAPPEVVEEDAPPVPADEVEW